jgi:dTDP-4-dehydrorhamnose 3,5-epimerase
MTEITESALIPGVKLVQFRVFTDDRGQFMETFRKDWFPERTWEIVQTNRSESAANVLRGLHYHHHQVDFWQVMTGAIRVALVDVRRGSPAFGRVETLDLSATAAHGLLIPPGVAHGFLALEPSILLYLVDNYYDGSDEFGIAWDDPELAIPWGCAAPLLSGRDRANLRLRAIPAEQLPA